MTTDVVIPEIVELPPELECLTPKQRDVSLCYAEIGSKIQAYTQVYDCSRMQRKTIERKALEVFANPKVAAAVDMLTLEKYKRHRVTVDRLVQEMAEAAFLDPADFIDIAEDGGISINFARMPQRLRQLCSFEQDEHYVGGKLVSRKTRIKWLDKQKAQEMLARHLGMFNPDAANRVDRVTFIFDM